MTARRCLSAALVALSAALFQVPAVHAQEQDRAAQFQSLGWQAGPTTADIGGLATIAVPEGYMFVGRGGAGKFMELLQNPSDGSELGVLLHREKSWFVVFEFSDDGYVKDTDRDLDADAILASIKKGTDQANELRRERGWSTMEIVGWQQKPFYDPATNNLTWSVRGSSEGTIGINHSTRLLGRRGVMKVNLVFGPEDQATALPAFTTLMGGFSFKPGHRYAEFTRGDKVAEYGLTGLIVGGTGVALVKSGLLQKFWKLIVLGVVAAAGAIRRLFAGSGAPREAGDTPSNV
jgi:uncharacterized membrane-anchored protein